MTKRNKNANNKSKIEIKKADFVLIITIFVIAVVAAFFASQTGRYSPDAKIRIQVAGKEYGTYELKEEREIVVKKEYENTILVGKDNLGNMYVNMKEANCPGRDCMNHAPINLPKQTIICLPNKLVVEIIGGESEIDAYTY